MKTSCNSFGETVYKWDNYYHPDNPGFMQIVYWTAWQKPDGRYSIGYSLGSGSKFKMVKWGTGDVKDDSLLGSEI